MQEKKGIIAILDALGASDYSKEGILKFLESREQVLALLDAKAKRFLGRVDAKRLASFTFNDTIIFTYETKPLVCLDDIRDFCYFLRYFEVKSLEY